MKGIKKALKEKAPIRGKINKSSGGTENKKAAEKPAKLQARLKKLQSEFISSTSHQFRTPLSTIQSSVELLDFYIKKGNTQRQVEIIDKIKRSILRLTDTIEKITELYKQSSLNEKPVLRNVDIRKFINELLEEVVVNITASHYIGVNIEQGIKNIKCDSFIVKQILLNLINNSVKFSPGGGQIRIEIRKRKGWFEFVVRDEGLGISESDMKNLFQPFYRGKNSGAIPGVGLGLAIVKNLAKMHKGQISCSSRINEGTEFIFRIK